MLKVDILKSWSIAFVLVSILLISFFSIVDDALFFHSDPASIFVLITALSAAAASALLPPLLLFGFLLRDPARPNRTLSLGVAAALVATLLLFALSYIYAKFELAEFVDRRWLAPGLLSAWLLALVGAALATARTAGRARIAERVQTLCVATATACLALLAVHLAIHYAPFKSGDRAQKHVVLIVLDGWPADLLNTFNAEMRKRPVDDLFRKGRVYHGMRTNANWTHGYFGALYWGNTEGVWRSRQSRSLSTTSSDGDSFPQRNLLGELQSLGVRARWITSHRLGIPESRPITRYAGLRSMFLTHRHAWLPRALGLDYHLVMPASEKSSLYETPAQRAVFRFVDAGGGKNPLLDVLLPEMEKIRVGTAESFLVFHTLWQMGMKGQPQAWETGGRGSFKKALGRIRARDYRYLPEEEPYALRMQSQNARFMNMLGLKLVDFFSRADEAGLLDDTMIILTADHGRIFSRGKFWYGYHADEEVMRVPMVVFGAGGGKMDDRPRETIDIAQTLIEYFGGSTALHPRAVSLLSDSPKPFAEGLTLASRKNREWFLLLYTEDRKFLFNLHARGNGDAIEMRIDGFDAIPVRRGKQVIRKQARQLAQALRDYGLSGQKLHARYAALLKP